MTEKIFNFKEQFEKQKEFYDAFVSYVKERSNVLGITQANKEEEARGIDFWAIEIGGRNIPIEVKCDFWLHKTGNIAVETVSGITYANSQPGWVFKLYNVELLAIIDPDSGNFYLLNARKFFWEVITWVRRYKSFSAHNKNPEAGEEWFSIGVLVPLDSLSGCIVDKGNIYNLRSGDSALLTPNKGIEAPHADKSSVSG